MPIIEEEFTDPVLDTPTPSAPPEDYDYVEVAETGEPLRRAMSPVTHNVNEESIPKEPKDALAKSQTFPKSVWANLYNDTEETKSEGLDEFEAPVAPTPAPADPVQEAVDSATQPTGQTMTEAERQQALESYQRDVMERVPSLQEECYLGKVTDFCRISDPESKQFRAAGERERLQQKQLVDFCSAAVRDFLHGQRDESATFHTFTVDGAKAVVYAFITAANNNLYPTEDSEAFFGVEVPDIESLLKGCSLMDENRPSHLDTEERKQFEESTFGLLVWRTWKIMIRTPEGRKVMLAELLKQCDNEDEEKTMLNSYSAVEAVLVECLLTNTVRAKFIEWTQALPVSNIMQNRCLMPREQKFLVQSLHNGEPVEWLHSHRRG